MRKAEHLLSPSPICVGQLDFVGKDLLKQGRIEGRLTSSSGRDFAGLGILPLDIGGEEGVEDFDE